MARRRDLEARATALHAALDQATAERDELDTIAQELAAIERHTAQQLDTALRLFDSLARAVTTWERHAGMDRSVSAHTRAIAQGRLATRAAELRAQRCALTAEQQETPDDQP